MKAKVSERNIQEAVVARLRWHGWMVRELSQPQAVTRELVGVPDVIAWKMGHTLLIECKRRGGKMRESQRQFAEEIGPHERLTLASTQASDVDEFADFLQKHEAGADIVTIREMRP